jgi:FMN phosphatase YigB (HAD superfamily)
MKFVLDFDRTLFDTHNCYQALRDIWGESLDFTPELWTGFNAQAYLYPDVMEWLTSKHQADLYIVTAHTPSHGPQSEEYQIEKLHRSGLHAHTHSVTIMEGLKGPTVADLATLWPSDELIVFVDDKREQCLSVKQHNPNAICCLMARDKSVIGDIDEVQGMPVVHCLADVDDVINKI